MDVFAFREKLVEEYGRFTRSFCKIHAQDIREFVRGKYAEEKFWPSPIIQLNPNFKAGGRVDELVEQGLLEPKCASVFVKNSDPLTLYQHQVDAIQAARSGDSYVLTTGTGSGKSLAYFIPIIDDVLRRKRQRATGPGITAIVVYPMNALCNSQLEELQGFLGRCDKNNTPSVTYARYTGQDSAEHRDWVAANPPDILLTNYVMLELIMTRFLVPDKAIRKQAKGLRYLVLDELHTYRGRQGADVAMLVRRVRERFNRDLQCIGTSATMSSGEDSPIERNKTVAGVASRLFGAVVKPKHVITETLTSVTDEYSVPDGTVLRELIQRGVPTAASFDALKQHPFAAWVEWTLGLSRADNRLVRVPRPLTVNQAVYKLSTASELHTALCRKYLTDFLLSAYRKKDAIGRSLFAFRLHQFISGAWSVFTSLEPPGKRYLTLNGQQYVPVDDERNRRLFSLCFCRQCGQEYIPVWASKQGQRIESLEPRDLTERSNDDETLQSGFVLTDPDCPFRPDVVTENYPEHWVEVFHGKPRLKSHYRKYRPIAIRVDTMGRVSDPGTSGWFIPGPFRFCLASKCTAQYSGHVRSDLSKLSSLSSEGRSSATTMLTLSVLKRLIEGELNDEAKKLLAFTDNRQDASLQAGHFNDFIQVLLLRSALVAAVKDSKTNTLSDDTVAQRVYEKLHLTKEQYAANPDIRGPARERTRQTLLNVLGYRIYRDLERGWRINNPNLEQLRLLKIRYRGLEDCCKDAEMWAHGPQLLAAAPPTRRHNIAFDLLERMRRALCIKTIYLDRNHLERLRNQSYNELREPWGLAEGEQIGAAKSMLPQARKGKGAYGHMYLSYRSEFARELNAAYRWGEDNPHFTGKIDKDLYTQLISTLLTALERYGLIEVMPLAGKQTGYQVNSSVMEWHFEANQEDGIDANRFFRKLYQDTAELLSDNKNFLHKIEAREHTAQVESEDREDREERFRKGLQKHGLPVLFCSPTMELGVDIATLNTVYMRNVPPTPANYVQRGGRAGRSGQPALVVTYCAARSPHDQYFFQDPPRMVAGEVNPPSIDLANEELVRSHLHAVWLAETGVKLESNVKDLLDRGDAKQPIQADLRRNLDRPQVGKRTTARAHRILRTMEGDLNKKAAPWYTETWVDGVLKATLSRLDAVLDRWRSLYRATETQIGKAREVQDNPVATEKDRDEANRRHQEAYRQQKLLLSDKHQQHSDFGTYRYLASQGFLPGYNFPRLPLMAFIPGSRLTGSRQSVLNRPRFIGLSEFGPQSFIYHEGSTYRVARAMLSIDEAADTSQKRMLPVREVVICALCGYGHFADEKDSECCVRCNCALSDALRIYNLFRIEQVSTQRTNRITSDEEERHRQGYEMITTYKFASKNGSPQMESYRYKLDGNSVVMEYGPAATLWRINLGWRRRRERTIYGFNVDPTTGLWSRNEQAPTDAEDDRIEKSTNTERITPYVKDTKNVLVIKPPTELDETAITTLQYALKRGIEKIYQLENSELAAEPLPAASDRQAILLYEASEGGAGVLTRIASDAGALGRVAQAALEICHFAAEPTHWSKAEYLTNQDEKCEAGCYRCLLSYYNQIDHASIDRKDKVVINLLCQLTVACRERTEGHSSSFEDLLKRCDSTLEEAWLRHLKDNGFRLPDRAQPLLKEFNTRPDFQYGDYQALIYIDGPHHLAEQQRQKDEAIRASLEDAGYVVVRFGHIPSEWSNIIDRFAWIFKPTGKFAFNE